MSKTPMPSPRGTNREGAYLPSGSRVVAAYDAEPADSDYSLLLGFLKDKLEPADFAHAQRLLGVEDEPDDSEASGASDAARRRYAEDARALHQRGHISAHELERRMIAGPPRRESEADRKRFAEMFPNAARLKVL